ncbi:nonribosomal peptide synthetase MxaA [Terrihabitans sp. B22-R8]|uniref:nonribosomal peptide synthetase MxaA n=1 Tax=Terrihabitans sp. B22-R8 TaxID=3425128 RepID=UPI00403C03CA
MVPALLALLPMAVSPTQSHGQEVTLYAPRPFGHLIGDTIALSADITLDEGLTLDPASLPQPRPVDYWLDLRDVRLTDQGIRAGERRYRLDFTYQTFYAPLEPKRLTIPPVPVAAFGEERRIALTIPSWSFVTSPLREITGGSGEVMVPRPDIAPRPIPTGRTLALFLTGLALSALAGAGLAWQRGLWPFHTRRNRPFLTAGRVVRTVLAHQPPNYDAALIALHRAFDKTAGKRVFAEDLTAFFAAHPDFRAAEPEIDRLFAASRRAFFAADLAAAQEELPARHLTELARSLRAIEQAAA